jgi:hypothetical protein
MKSDKKKPARQHQPSNVNDAEALGVDPETLHVLHRIARANEDAESVVDATGLTKSEFVKLIRSHIREMPAGLRDTLELIVSAVSPSDGSVFLVDSITDLQVADPTADTSKQPADAVRRGVASVPFGLIVDRKTDTTMRRPWTQDELSILHEAYACEANLNLASRLRRSVRSVVTKAHHLGLRKDFGLLRESQADQTKGKAANGGAA